MRDRPLFDSDEDSAVPDSDPEVIAGLLRKRVIDDAEELPELEPRD